jgi:hypothetical protein
MRDGHRGTHEVLGRPLGSDVASAGRVKWDLRR